MYHDEMILETADVRVRILTLTAGNATPWHRHSAVTDRMLGLSGALVVESRDPDEAFPLTPGDRCEIAVGRVHRVVNPTGEDARYLLVQGVGRYDFLALE